MEDTDFDILCEGAPPEEAKRLRKLMADWYDGDENSFPVQLVLLTRAQWRIAARIPVLVQESSKLLDAKLAQFRQEVTAAGQDFKRNMEPQLQAVREIQKENVRQDREAKEAVRSHLAQIGGFAKLMEDNIRSMGEESRRAREFCEAERAKLDKAFAATKILWDLRQTALVVMLILALSGGSLLAGHYLWR
jgi:hypothetical protein